MLRLTPIFLTAAAMAGSAVAAKPAAPACSLSKADQHWVNTSMKAWNFTSKKITGIGRVKVIEAVFFDDDCVVTSKTAMNGGPNKWSATSHNGEVTIPNGSKIPAGVTSFAQSGEGQAYFVMSTPSIWRAAKIPDNDLGSLETLMTLVILHEGTHVAQMPTYGKRIGATAKKYGLPESWDDDAIQEQFKTDKEFTASIWREVDMFLAAAQAPDRGTALKLAREARQLMRARQARWFVGKDVYHAAGEELFLTLEGSAQWAAYQWAIHPNGGKVEKTAAFNSFGRRRGWWSQDEGFALFMTLDRLTNGSWKKHAFGDGAKTALQMLDEAIG